jgi:hypothetical protein
MYFPLFFALIGNLQRQVSIIQQSQKDSCKMIILSKEQVLKLHASLNKSHWRK